MVISVADNDEAEAKPAKWVHFAFAAYLRFLAIIFFAASIYVWLRVVGYWDGADNRFDTMSVVQKIFSAIMVVILPVTSVGLWTTLAWGRVVWFLAIALQMLAILRFGDSLALPIEVVYFHLASLLIYAAFQILLYFIDKKE